MIEPLLQIDDLRLDVPAPGKQRRMILGGVGLNISAGEAVGLVGESGSGKSMTARTILRLMPAGSNASGEIRFRGRDVLTMSRKELHQLRAQEIAMVFQDPRGTVNPVRTVGDYLLEGMLDRGIGKQEATASAIRILTDIGVDRPERRLQQRPFELSGGLLQRVVIAAALAAEPELILADEPTTALDVTTQEEVVAILDEQRRKRGMAMLLITHDLELAAAVCDRIAVMYAGQIVEEVTARELHSRARHRYTDALMASRPGSAPPGAKLRTVAGRPQSAYDAPKLCVFSDRCPSADDLCRTERAPITVSSAGWSRCHHPVERD